MELLPFLDVLAALFQRLVVRKIPELMKPRHRLAPIRRGALWFAAGRAGKGLLGFLVLEGMEEREAFFDGGLHLGGATRGEIHFTELIQRRGGQAVRSQSCRLNSENK